MTNEELILKVIALQNEISNLKVKNNKQNNQLKFEYADFKSAENMEMSIDLGENMREQLKNVFNILNIK